MADRLHIVRAEPIPSTILTTLQQEGQEGWGVRGYPERLAREFSRSQVAAGLVQLALIVEPVDRVLGRDAAQPVAKAFGAGSLIGLRVAAACVDDVDMAFSRIALLPSPESADDEDNLHTRQLFANEIVNIGDEAYAGVQHIFEPLFDDWEQQLVPEVRYQRFLCSGFGIPMAYLRERYAENEAADLQAMEAQIKAAEADGIDWDALLVQ